jgi:DNA uptake protein ComE-like DNA-binding protein
MRMVTGVTTWAACIALVLGASAAARAATNEIVREARTWTSDSGATVDARLVFNYGHWVKLAKQDGKEITVPTQSLCDEDRKYLQGIVVAGKYVSPFARKQEDDDRLDLNSASIVELMFLPKIGEKTARLIIKRRPFKRTRDLLEVPGIGEKTFAMLEDFVTVRKIKRQKQR